MKKFNILTICFLLFVQSVVAQTKTDLQLDVLQQQDISFNYQTIEELEADKVIPNAIVLKNSAKRNFTKIYCSLLLNGSTNGATLPKLYIQESNTKNPAVLLTNTPQLLYSYTTDNITNNIFFDIKIPKQVKWIPKGDYSFTVVFSTMP